MPDSPKKETAAITYKFDCLRGAFEGIIFSGLMTFGLLIAIREFSAPAWIKSFLSINTGRLLAPVLLIIAYRWRKRISAICGLMLLLTSLSLVLTAAATNVIIYSLGLFMAYIFFAQPPGLMIQVYSRNYTSKERGNRVSSIFVLSTTLGALFAEFGGKWLDVDIQHFRFLFLIMALSGLISAWSLNKIPSEPLIKLETDDSHFWRNIKLIWRDKLFGWLLLAFSLLAMGNSIAVPIRIEYLAQEQYGINASNEIIALLIYVVPAMLIIISIKVWGFLFDRLRFITTRILSNICFILSIIFFFNTQDIYCLLLSSALSGVAVAGHIVMWHLWVTKIAPKHKVAAYMSIHTAVSGFKGFIAPFIGYYLLHKTNPIFVGNICMGLFIAASIMLLMAWKRERIL